MGLGSASHVILCGTCTYSLVCTYVFLSFLYRLLCFSMFQPFHKHSQKKKLTIFPSSLLFSSLNNYTRYPVKKKISPILFPTLLPCTHSLFQALLMLLLVLVTCYTNIR
ncbi:hypothetical protein F5X96DRAFT_349354 [Biscogniauxia mediterranea]|nr:hypothetical protein F5X96DRAFT_349354 [Biscogniauxia mediterranea]